MKANLTTGEKLQDLRKERGLTIKQVCDMIQTKYNFTLSTGKLNEMENDKPKDHGFKSFVYLAKFYNVSVDYLLRLSDISSIPTDGKLQAAAEVTGFSEKALSKLSEFKAMNQKTQYTDTLSLLIESMNMEYLLALMTALISQNVKSNNAHNGNDTEIVRYLIDATMPLDIDGTKVNIYKSTLLSSALQNAIVDTIDMISENFSENGGAENGKHNPSKE